jgi:hypothetical protein
VCACVARSLGVATVLITDLLFPIRNLNLYRAPCKACKGVDVFSRKNKAEQAQASRTPPPFRSSFFQVQTDCGFILEHFQVTVLTEGT